MSLRSHTQIVTDAEPVEINIATMNAKHIVSVETEAGGTLTIKVKAPGNPEYQNFTGNTIDCTAPTPIKFEMPLEGIELSIDSGSCTVHYMLGYAD